MNNAFKPGNTYAVKHGMCGTPFYYCWQNMKKRCDNPKDKDYPNYGGRGITYDPDWKKFENFLQDMAETYQEGLELDRIDNNGGYYRENCQWVSRLHNACNQKRTVWTDTPEYGRIPLSVLVRKCGVPRSTIKDRLRRGLSPF